MLTLEEKRDIIAEKIELMKQFGIFSGRTRKERSTIISILAECNSEIQIEQKLHNVLHGKETLDDFIDRHNMSLVRQI